MFRVHARTLQCCLPFYILGQYNTVNVLYRLRRISPPPPPKNASPEGRVHRHLRCAAEHSKVPLLQGSISPGKCYDVQARSSHVRRVDGLASPALQDRASTVPEIGTRGRGGGKQGTVVPAASRFHLSVQALLYSIEWGISAYQCPANADNTA